MVKKAISGHYILFEIAVLAVSLCDFLSLIIIHADLIRLNVTPAFHLNLFLQTLILIS